MTEFEDLASWYEEQPPMEQVICEQVEAEGSAPLAFYLALAVALERDPGEFFEVFVKPLVDKKLIQSEGPNLLITEEGRNFLRAYAAQLISTT